MDTLAFCKAFDGLVVATYILVNLSMPGACLGVLWSDPVSPIVSTVLSYDRIIETEF